MKKFHSLSTLHVMVLLCLVAVAALLCCSTELFHPTGRRTRFEFNVEGSSVPGFERTVTVYTGDGVTDVAFSGKLTVDGTAEITLVSNEGGRSVYCAAYTACAAKALNFEIDGLAPCTYYTLSFTSSDALIGRLTLETDRALAERPQIPGHPARSTAERLMGKS